MGLEHKLVGTISHGANAASAPHSWHTSSPSKVHTRRDNARAELLREMIRTVLINARYREMMRGE